MITARPIPPVIPESYEHSQPVAATTWTVNHNLGYKPVVSVYNVGSQEVDATVTHISVNQTVISFSVAVAGFARFV